MSFFGKKTTREEAEKRKDHVIGTGGKVDAVVMALIESANDSDAQVRETVYDTLQEIGKKQLNLVLSSCFEFMTKNSKASRDHRIILLRLILFLLGEKRDEVHEDLLKIDLLKLVMGEMLASKDVVTEWQLPACQIMVNIGLRFPNSVFDALIQNFQPGTVPHYFVMKTLGDLAVANPLDIVPRLKEVLARVLPVLASIKLEHVRYIFAVAMGQFCEAILNYVANLDKASDKTLSVDSFSSEMFPAWEVMFNNWLGSREKKLRLATVQSLGNMCAVLKREQFDAQVPRFIPAILALFKKEKEQLPITQGMCMILDVAVKGGSTVLQPQLREILAVLHPLACVPADYSVSASIKNHNELLRCLEILGRVFADPLVHFLLQKLEAKEPIVREGTLDILRHLITRLQTELDEQKPLLVSGVKQLAANEPNLRVKRAIAQVMIAMASHNYLHLEGGLSLVEFIIANAAISDAEVDKAKTAKRAADELTPGELRDMCDNILTLVTTTIAPMESVLWPYLLEVVVPGRFTGALGVVCKCLGYLAARKREEEAEEYVIDFDKEVNLPKPQQLLARLFVVLSAPLRRGDVGVHILNMLRALGPVLHPSLPDMWDHALPKLVKYLEDNRGSDTWKPQAWEDLVLRLLSETVKVVNDDEWTLQLGEHLAGQFELYAGDHDLKRAAFKQLGLVLQKLNHKEFIRTKLAALFAACQHGSEAERVGCAQAFGLAAASHLDITLEKIEAITKGDPKGASKGLSLFASSKEKEDGSGGDVKKTLMLCYGYVAAYAPPELVTSRLDVNIINNMKPKMVAVKNPLVKEAVIKSLDLIGKAMHPSRLGKPYIVKQRDELVKLLVGYMTPQNASEVTMQVRILALNCLSTLVFLEPLLPRELEAMVVDKTLAFYSLPPHEPKTDDKDDKAAALETMLANLNDLLAALLYMDTTVACLQRLLDALRPYTVRDPHHRMRSMATVLYVLKKFIEYKTSETDHTKTEPEFSKLGTYLAFLVPRCTDPEPRVRATAVEAVGILLYIDHLLRNVPKENAAAGPITVPPPQELRPISGLRDQITAGEANEQFATVHELAGILGRLVSKEQLPELLAALLAGLTDPQPASGSGTCVALNGLIKQRGAELLERLPLLIEGLLAALAKIANDQTKNGTLHAIRSLAAHHLLPVLNELLAASLPHPENVVKSFQVIAKDKKLVFPMIDHLFDIINNGQLEEIDPRNPGGPGTKRPPAPATKLAMSATCALGEIMQLADMEAVIAERYYQFAASLLLRFGSANGCKGPEPAQQIVATFKQFVECAKEEALKTMLDANNGERWKTLTTDKYPSVLTEITAVMCRDHTQHMRAIFDYLVPYQKSNYMGQRVVAVTVFAEFVNHVKDDKDLLQQLMNRLLAAMIEPPLKLHALIGLGNVVSAGEAEVNKYAPTVLDALMTHIDDKDETIAMESMNGLSKVFELVDETRVAPVIVNLCHRIRPAFEKENAEIRAAAFTLFGTLSLFGSGEALDPFYEQIHTYMPALLFHINDESPDVSKACRRAVGKLGPLMRAEEIDALCNSKIFDEEAKGPFPYTSFLADIAKLLLKYYPDRLNHYVMTSIDFFKSHWTVLRANAATFLGFLLGNMTPEIKKVANINTTIVTGALVSLLHEKSPQVRKAMAEGMRYLINW